VRFDEEFSVEMLFTVIPGACGTGSGLAKSIQEAKGQVRRILGQRA
jgi:hypothetical protein